MPITQERLNKAVECGRAAFKTLDLIHEALQEALFLPDNQLRGEIERLLVIHRAPNDGTLSVEEDRLRRFGRKNEAARERLAMKRYNRRPMPAPSTGAAPEAKPLPSSSTTPEGADLDFPPEPETPTTAPATPIMQSADVAAAAKELGLSPEDYLEYLEYNANKPKE